MNSALSFTWTDDGCFVPLPHCVRFADARYVVGQVYKLDEVQEHSVKNRNHYFAALHEAWKNLPEAIAWRFPTSETLRKSLLIKAGYRDEKQVACSSDEEARKLVAIVTGMDEHAVVILRGDVVWILTAKSQKANQMSKEDFQASKTAVLELAANMVGVTPKQLQNESGRLA